MSKFLTADQKESTLMSTMRSQLISHRPTQTMGIDKKSGRLKLICILFVFCIGATIALPAQTFTKLVSFDFTNGAFPSYGTLAADGKGNFYGTTIAGGPIGAGTVFEITAENN
jgi:uncharacterized repeat protein (TIGR03803 family)